MANALLPEYLQFHGQSRNTGCMTVQSDLGTALIYMMDGEVIHAESEGQRGIIALFQAMGWDPVTISWQEGAIPPVVQSRHPVDALLFQYAQLEDTQQTDMESLQRNFGDSTHEPDDIRLMDLGQYQISFEVLNTPFRGFLFYLEKAVSLVGRGEDCDIILPDASVSSHHCKITLEKHCIRVVDLGSTNGTRINNEIIAERILQPGDAFQIGSVMVAMNLKLRRNLDAQKVALTTKQLNVSTLAASGQTQLIDPKALMKKSGKLEGPITWKNLTGEGAKKGDNSLFTKMFGKK
ncbi:MAG: FHA domain-containing protein [Candidatus Methylacidiphilales bacterium]|nr:FHA domain-containing protein [Candidatus Methylacidiphilales bacterium]